MARAGIQMSHCMEYLQCTVDKAMMNYFYCTKRLCRMMRFMKMLQAFHMVHSIVNPVK